MNRVLDRVDSPDDVKALAGGELPLLAADIRELIIETLSRTGGHLGANLGAVELTLALLRVFDPPRDSILWDVSHQAYAYKILTGRRDRFHTIRQFGGLSGFLKRDESEYDAFGAGHSGTAISAALGFAVGRDLVGGKEHVVAVVGDGSMGCGIVYEALNNVATSTKRLIVVLNDNEMSIAANVGAMSRYLGSLLSNPRYNRWKRSVESMATTWLRMGWLRAAYYRMEEAVKSLFLRSVIFEEFGLRYIGPVDGHNLDALVDALSIAKDSDKPILLHVATQKGKGYSFAEAFPEKWHGTSGFDVATGNARSSKKTTTYSDVFGAAIKRLAQEDPRVVVLTAAMPAGTGLAEFAKLHPDRFFDVGISEEHAVVFAAGMAAAGRRPVFAVYSTFVQRAVDCVIHDVCLQNLPVVLCLDRAGVVGDDGPTHHGVFDLAIFRSVPGLTIMQPGDEAELADMLYTAVRLGRPVVIRYPRGAGLGVPVPAAFTEMAVGKAVVRREGRGVQLWALGDMLSLADEVSDRLAREGVDAGIVNPRFVRPLDEELLGRQACDARVIATLENGVASGGFGSLVEESLVRQHFAGKIRRFGWPDSFVTHGAVEQLRLQAGLTADVIAAEIQSALK